METMLITTLSVNFKINRLIEDRLHASDCDVSMDIEFQDGHVASEHKEHLTLMKHWLDEVLNNCIAFNIHNPLNTELFGQVANQVMFCPDEPHDHILLMLVMAKLNAIGAGAVMVNSASIHSDTSHGFGSNLVGDPSDMLPSAEEWMGVTRYWDEPWWNRPDGGMMDLPVAEGEDPSIKPDILFDMRSKGISMVRDDGTIDVEADPEAKPAEIIRPNFKPKIIRND
jgi:hypothetical protein